MKLDEENILKYTCKLTPEGKEVLYVSDGTTMLFEICSNNKSIAVGLDKDDIKELIEYLIKFL